MIAYVFQTYPGNFAFQQFIIPAIYNLTIYNFAFQLFIIFIFIIYDSIT